MATRRTNYYVTTYGTHRDLAEARSTSSSKPYNTNDQFNHPGITDELDALFSKDPYWQPEIVLYPPSGPSQRRYMFLNTEGPSTNCVKINKGPGYDLSLANQ